MPGHLTEAPQDLPQHLVPSPAAVDQLKQEFLSINHTALPGLRHTQKERTHTRTQTHKMTNTHTHRHTHTQLSQQKTRQ